MKKFFLSGVVLAILFIPSFASVKTASPVFFKEDFLSQTGSLPSTVLFTPVKDEECHISAYVENVSLSSAGVGVALTWTDAERVQNSTLGLRNSPGFGYIPNVFMIHAKANTPVSINVDDLGSGTQTYNLYVSSICQ